MYDSATGPGYGIGGAKGITGGRRAFKGALLEGGIGVPFIARWPGKIPAGKIDKSSIFSAVDLLLPFANWPKLVFQNLTNQMESVRLEC